MDYETKRALQRARKGRRMPELERELRCRNNTDHSLPNTDPWRCLAVAVIRQAADDVIWCVTGTRTDAKARMMTELDLFFRSRWYAVLLDGDEYDSPERLARAIFEKVSDARRLFDEDMERVYDILAAEDARKADDQRRALTHRESIDWMRREKERRAEKERQRVAVYARLSDDSRARLSRIRTKCGISNGIHG